MLRPQLSIRLLLRASRPCLRLAYATTTESQASPILLKLRSDLKTAMKAKDTSRLNVLRALLADITNASKSSTPIKTDIQLLSLLRKRAAASKTASDEFQAANRSDLADKENEQIAILEEYAGSVDTLSRDDIVGFVTTTIDSLKAEGARTDMGSVLKTVLGPGGALEAKPVDKSEVAKVVKELLGK